MADGSAITETTDGGTVRGPFPADNPAQARIAEIDATATTLRFEVATSTGGNVARFDDYVREGREAAEFGSFT